MRSLRGLLVSSLMAVLGYGCGETPPPPDAEVAAFFLHYQDVPMQDSIGPVAQRLSRESLLFPTSTDAELGEESMAIALAYDNRGIPWAYGYTSETTLSEAQPDGTRYFGMSFPDAIAMLELNTRLGGLVIDSATQPGYIIPRELVQDAVDAVRLSGE